ncbi:MAG: hypothetical protein QOK04_2476, partial [Solirubrobacteraceae bacterium]|nr:hypothetical protein [Solirubrobacteraceae bacterium]
DARRDGRQASWWRGGRKRTCHPARLTLRDEGPLSLVAVWPRYAATRRGSGGLSAAAVLVIGSAS